MHSWLVFLAILGFFAIAARALRAWMRAARCGVDAFAAVALAETRASHGDLTGMRDAEGDAERARQRRRRALGGGLVWGTLLIVPALTGEAVRLYAAASVLWIPTLAGRAGLGR